MIEIIKPENREHWLKLRSLDVTSTEVAALFGISPYLTEFELWHQKKAGLVVELEESGRMKWGSRLQDAIAQGIATDNGWDVRLMEEYIRDPDLRAGASFDYEIRSPIKGLLEIKNVDALIFRDGWAVDEDGDLEAPPHIELQVQQQLMLSHKPIAYIGALVGGNRIEEIKRLPDEAVHAAIRQKVAQFWESIDLNQPPEPDFIRDAEFITKLYGYAEPGKVVDASGDDEFSMWAMEYKRLGDEIKTMTEVRDGYKARMIQRMQDAEKVLGLGFTVSAGVVAEADISYHRKAYRTFKCTWKKVKG